MGTQSFDDRMASFSLRVARQKHGALDPEGAVWKAAVSATPSIEVHGVAHLHGSCFLSAMVGHCDVATA